MPLGSPACGGLGVAILVGCPEAQEGSEVKEVCEVKEVEETENAKEGRYDFVRLGSFA